MYNILASALFLVGFLVVLFSLPPNVKFMWLAPYTWISCQQMCSRTRVGSCCCDWSLLFFYWWSFFPLLGTMVGSVRCWCSPPVDPKPLRRAKQWQPSQRTGCWAVGRPKVVQDHPPCPLRAKHKEIRMEKQKQKPATTDSLFFGLLIFSQALLNATHAWSISVYFLSVLIHAHLICALMLPLTRRSLPFRSTRRSQPTGEQYSSTPILAVSLFILSLLPMVYCLVQLFAPFLYLFAVCKTKNKRTRMWERREKRERERE